MDQRCHGARSVMADWSNHWDAVQNILADLCSLVHYEE